MSSSSISARPDVAVAQTAPRVTPTPPRTAFKEVLGQTVVGSAEAAMKMLPGSPLMAVAIRGATGQSGSALGVPVTSPASLSTRSAEGPTVGSTSSGIGGAIGGAVSGTTTGAEPGVESSLQQSQDMNLYYLQIQEQVNAQNRSFTALSNVLKAEHDTVKTAIGNIR